MANKLQRLLGTLGLVVLAFAIAKVGRMGLDWVIRLQPEWAAFVERVGGWLIGLVVVIAVLIPLFRLYGILEKSDVSS